MELTDRARHNPALRYAALTGMLTAALVAGYWSLRLAWADRLSRSTDLADLSHAVALSPNNASFRVRLARLLDKNGADPAQGLETAAVLNPHDPAVWITLGLNAERHGEARMAEHDLLEAARVSRQFEPRWTLAGYYVRHGDTANFWPWVRRSLLVGSGDLNPVFALCWTMSQDGAFILDQAIPERRPVLNAYLRFLLQQDRLSAAVPVARKLTALATESDRPALLASTDHLLEAGESADALELWNAMCARRLLPYRALDPDHGVSLTDGAFTAEPAGGGFGWRLTNATGITCGRNASQPYMWLSLSGSQPPHCEPLSQYIPLVSGKPYRLRFQYRTSDLPPESGLRWQVLDASNGADLAARSPWLSSPAWKADEVVFAAPPKALARLVLSYQAVNGAPRLEGSVLLSNLRLERLP